MIELSRYAYQNKTLENILRIIYLSNIEHGVTTSRIHFYHFCLGSVCLGFFFENFFHVCKAKTIFKKMQFLAVTYDMEVLSLSFRRCLIGSVFPLFIQILKAEMTCSQPVIVRDCIFKNQNFCFASR